MARLVAILTIIAGLGLLAGATLFKVQPDSVIPVARSVGFNPFDVVMDPIPVDRANPPLPAARFVETGTATLTRFEAGAEYVPEPDQGTLHRGPGGLVWWGWGPTGDTRRPTVVLLHGPGRTGESMVDMWRETAERQGLVIVAPNLGNLPGWEFGRPDPRAVAIALDAAAEIYPVDKGRVALFGHSRGAIAAQVLANQYSGPWKAVAVHGGTLPLNYVAPAARPLPIRHYLGSVDQSFPYATALESGAALADAGHPFELVRLHGHDHWFYEAGEDIAAHAWGWLETQIR
ncbi:MAG: hypothetical protein AAF919_00300 [Pseudomonadota bacterium]